MRKVAYGECRKWGLTPFSAAAGERKVLAPEAHLPVALREHLLVIELCRSVAFARRLFEPPAIRDVHFAAMQFQ